MQRRKIGRCNNRRHVCIYDAPAYSAVAAAYHPDHPFSWPTMPQLLASGFLARATSSRLLLPPLRLPRALGALALPALRPALATAGCSAGAASEAPSASSMLSMLSRTALRIALICLRAAT